MEEGVGEVFHLRERHRELFEKLSTPVLTWEEQVNVSETGQLVVSSCDVQGTYLSAGR